MKKYSKIGAVLMCFLLATSFAYSQGARSHKGFFKNKSRVGLLVIVYPIEASKSSMMPIGMLGPVPLVTKVGSKKTEKYDSALRTIEPKVRPDSLVRNFYLSTYSRVKEVSFVPDSLTFDFPKFRGVQEDNKSYFTKDIRSLKNKFQIDELLIVYVRYGISTTKSMGIQLSMSAVASIESEVIDLSTNAYIIRQGSQAGTADIPKWNSPPDFESLREGVHSVLLKVIEKERKKYKFLEQTDK